MLHVFKDIKTEPTIVRELPSFSYEQIFENTPEIDASIRASESNDIISIKTVVDTGAARSLPNDQSVEYSAVQFAVLAIDCKQELS